MIRFLGRIKIDFYIKIFVYTNISYRHFKLKMSSELLLEVIRCVKYKRDSAAITYGRAATANLYETQIIQAKTANERGDIESLQRIIHWLKTY